MVSKPAKIMTVKTICIIWLAKSPNMFVIYVDIFLEDRTAFVVLLFLALVCRSCVYIR